MYASLHFPQKRGVSCTTIISSGFPFINGFFRKIRIIFGNRKQPCLLQLLRGGHFPPAHINIKQREPADKFAVSPCRAIEFAETLCIYKRQYADIVYCFCADIGDYITAIPYMHSALHRMAQSVGTIILPPVFIKSDNVRALQFKNIILYLCI